MSATQCPIAPSSATTPKINPDANAPALQPPQTLPPQGIAVIPQQKTNASAAPGQPTILGQLPAPRSLGNPPSPQPSVPAQPQQLQASVAVWIPISGLRRPRSAVTMGKMKTQCRMGVARLFSLTMAVALTVMSCTNPPAPPSPAPPPSQQQLSPPNITSPLYKGAEIVETYGVPGAEIRILANGKDIGGKTCGSAQCWILVQPLEWSVNPSSPTRITATQKAGGITSSPTRAGEEILVEKIPDEYLTPDHEKLLPPSIGDPLAACQQAVLLEKTVPGARVKVFSLPDDKNPIGQAQWPWKAAVAGTGKELTEGESIAANQELVLPPVGLTQPARLVQPKPTQMKKPVWNPTALVPNQDAVVVGDLSIGATVDIYYEAQGTRTSLGGGVAVWPNQEFGIKPLEQSWIGCTDCIKVDQFLCQADKVVGTSEGKDVGKTLDPPKIDGVICAGSYKVTACNTTPKSILTVWRAKSGALYEQVGETGGTGYCIPVTLGDDLVLDKGDQVKVRQEAWNLKSESNVVTVDGQAQPELAIANGNRCKQCAGQADGPVFVRDMLTSTNEQGPVFTATMCDAEAATVDILDPAGKQIDSIILKGIKGKKGYFEGSWNWNKIGWKTSKDIPVGMYTAKFKLGGYPQQDKHFYVYTKGCVEMEVLCAHNKYRDQVVGVAPLIWSDTLADHAQQWADYLNMTHQQKHDDTIKGIEGENIGYGYFSYTDAIAGADGWGYEKKCFKNGTFPDIYNGQCDDYAVNSCNIYHNTDKSWACAGHYSQMVWSKTKEVGCGMANGIVVCRYSPPGNFSGESAY